jgi:hypothetical protein
MVSKENEKEKKKPKYGPIKITIVFPSKKEMRERKKAREKENRE